MQLLTPLKKKVNFEVEKLMSKPINVQHNLTKNERDTLKDLAENDNIVIKRAHIV